MKAIIPHRLTKAEKEMAENVIKEADAYIQDLQHKAILRVVKVACIVLNEEFGFGSQRLAKFFEEMENRGKISAENPEGWYLVDEKLHTLGLNFNDEDIEEREQHIRSLYHEQGRKYREY
jgi:hypothetical protein